MGLIAAIAPAAGLAALACLPLGILILARWAGLRGAALGPGARRRYLVPSLGLLGASWLGLIPLIHQRSSLGLPDLAWFLLASASALGLGRHVRRRIGDGGTDS